MYNTNWVQMLKGKELGSLRTYNKGTAWTGRYCSGPGSLPGRNDAWIEIDPDSPFTNRTSSSSLSFPIWGIIRVPHRRAAGRMKWDGARQGVSIVPGLYSIPSKWQPLVFPSLCFFKLQKQYVLIVKHVAIPEYNEWKNEGLPPTRRVPCEQLVSLPWTFSLRVRART